MAEATDRIVEDIELAREAMDRNLHALRTRLKQEVSPRVQARRHPLALAGVVAVVLLAGWLTVKVLRS